jgi:hypothetical protein
MRERPSTIRTLGSLVVGTALVLVAWGSTASQALAQGATPRLLISDDPKQPPSAKKDLLLRPNRDEAFFVYVENPGTTPTNVVVELAADGHSGEPARVSMTLEAGKTKQAVFPKPPGAAAAPAPAPPPAGAPPAPPPPPPGVPLSGPPFKFQVRLLEDNKEVDHKSVTRILAPHEYVGAVAQYNPRRGLLAVEVTAKPEFFGAPCPVELALPVDRIPGFKKPKKGTFRGVLRRPGDKVVLSAENFISIDAANKSGFVYVTVDGYERAFVFETNFGGGSFDPLQSRSIRLYAPAFSRPTAHFPVRVEVDNPPGPDDMSVKLGMYQDVAGELEKDILVDFPTGYRDEQLRVEAAGEGGAVVFHTLVRDWVREIDASGILGQRVLRAWMRDPAGAEVTVVNSIGEPVKAVTYVEAVDERLRHYDRVTFDDSEPEGLRLIAPAQAIRGTRLVLKATGSDPESGISRVLFYLARPTDEGKPPAGVEPIKALPPTAANPEWFTSFVVPKDAKSPLDVIVQAINGVGLSSFSTGSIEIADPAAAVAGAKTGKIAGIVTWGGRLSQPDVDVVLKDAKDPKAPEKKKTKTKDDGSYLFEDVEPGEYTVSAAKTESGGISRDDQKVTVEAGKTAKVDLDLVRKP